MIVTMMIGTMMIGTMMIGTMMIGIMMIVTMMIVTMMIGTMMIGTMMMIGTIIMYINEVCIKKDITLHIQNNFYAHLNKNARKKDVHSIKYFN
jgi:hypothetical protein